eukprot:3089769-Amphidinium_carterae.1
MRTVWKELACVPTTARLAVRILRVRLHIIASPSWDLLLVEKCVLTVAMALLASPGSCCCVHANEFS